MKTRLLVWLGMLACALVPMAHAVEILRWERLPPVSYTHLTLPTTPYV